MVYGMEKEGIERFRDYVEEEVINKIEKYQYEEGYEWILGLMEYAEDIEQVYEIGKAIDEQIQEEVKYGKDVGGIFTEEEEKELMAEGIRKAEKYEEEYRKEQEESKALIKGLLY